MTNKLPLNWCECKFSDLLEIYTGNSINEQEKVSKYTNLDSGYNYIGTKDISFDQTINYNNGVKIPFDNKNFKIAPKNTPLLCIEGGSAGRKLAYTKEDVCFGNKLCAFVSKNEIINLYIFYFLQSREFRSIFSLNKNGLIGGVSLNKIKNLGLRIPPLAEQKRIVGKIEEIFAKIDAGVEKLKSAQEKIKQYKQSVLHSAFTGKLYKATEWKSCTLGDIVSKDKYAMKRGPFGSSLKKEYFVEKGIRIFEQYNPINEDPYWARYFITKEKFKEMETFKAGAGDLLVSCSGTLGKILLLPDDVEDGIINQALLKIRLDNNKVLNLFFIHWFNSPKTQKLILDSVRGAAIQNIASVKELKQINFLLPTLPEQEKIVEEIEKRFAKADKMLEVVEKSLKSAEQLKQSVLKKAFEGKLVHQDPNDEPASVLLERIKSEKQQNEKVKGKKK